MLEQLQRGVHKRMACFRADMMLLRHVLVHGQCPQHLSENKKRVLRRKKEKYKIIGEKLFYKKKNNFAEVISTAEKVLEILKFYHEASGNHVGIVNTNKRISAKYYWRGFAQDIADYVSACPTCRTFEGVRTRAPELKQIKVTLPMEDVGTDLLAATEPCKQEDVSGDGGTDEDDSETLDISYLEPDAMLEFSPVQEQFGAKGKAGHQPPPASTSSHVADADDPLAQDAQTRISPSATTSGSGGPYLLKKETHCSTVLDQLMRDETFTDVTLTAEGQSLRAHRIVLCLASPYFRQVLSRDMMVQSVVVLRDIKFAELQNIIHFIYTGEATVDTSKLESFMKTAELLKIVSLCEGLKWTSNRGNISQNSCSSSFTIGDSERPVGTKRTKKQSSPTPSKVQRLLVTNQSRGSATGQTYSWRNLKIANEREETRVKVSVGLLPSPASRGSSTQTTGQDFSSIAEPSPVPPEDSTERQSPAENVTDTTVVPGRCPYCPHLVQKFEGMALMQHLLVLHPCKPAFPCNNCFRVFAKRSSFKSHRQKCQQALF